MCLVSTLFDKFYLYFLISLLMTQKNHVNNFVNQYNYQHIEFLLNPIYLFFVKISKILFQNTRIFYQLFIYNNVIHIQIS